MIRELCQQEIKLMIENCLQPHTTDVAVGMSVQIIAHGHIICGDRLRNGACCTTDMEKPARNLLTSPNLGECTVLCARDE